MNETYMFQFPIASITMIFNYKVHIIGISSIHLELGQSLNALSEFIIHESVTENIWYEGSNFVHLKSLFIKISIFLLQTFSKENIKGSQLGVFFLVKAMVYCITLNSNFHI